MKSLVPNAFFYFLLGYDNYVTSSTIKINNYHSFKHFRNFETQIF